MKKRFCITLTALMAVFTSVMSVYGVNEDSSSVTISQIEVVDYVLYAGAALFLLGMIFILIALFLKQSNKTTLSENEPESLYDENISDAPQTDTEDTLDEADDTEITDDDNNDGNIEEIENENLAEADDTPEEQDDTNTDDIPEDIEEIAEPEITEPEIIEPEVVEPELPSIRITFTGTNNPDLKILEFKDSATIGRKSTNDLMISDNAVSGIHCKVYYENDEVYIEDLGSTNGTILNGESITKEVLKSDDLLVLGKKQYKINISQSDL